MLSTLLNFNDKSPHFYIYYVENIERQFYPIRVVEQSRFVMDLQNILQALERAFDYAKCARASHI